MCSTIASPPLPPPAVLDAVVELMEENKFPNLSFSCQNVLSLNILTKSSKTDLKIHAVTKSNHDVVILCDTRLNSLKKKQLYMIYQKNLDLKGMILFTIPSQTVEGLQY